MPTYGRFGEQSAIDLGLRTAVIAGAIAGNLTVTGIRPGDKLVSVQPVNVAAANLVAEFTVSALNTINNTGGTSSATQVVLVIWQIAEAAQSGYAAT